MQIYMGKLDLTQALFISMDKDTAEYYIEVVEFNSEHYNMLLDREEEVITARSIHDFPRIANNPTWFICKFCAAREQCHMDTPVEMNCRTCQHVDICEEGRWACSKGDYLSLLEQVKGCSEYQLSEMFK